MVRHKKKYKIKFIASKIRFFNSYSPHFILQLYQRERPVRPFIECLVGEMPVRMLIDSGADVNTLSEKDWVELLSRYLEGESKITDLNWGNGKKVLTAYASDDPLRIEATFTSTILISKSEAID